MFQTLSLTVYGMHNMAHTLIPSIYNDKALTI